MRDKVFTDIKDYVEKYSGTTIPFWSDLAEKYHYENKEAIRSSFRRESRRRGYKLADAKKRNGGPKILIFDIETTPILGYFWDLWPQSIYTDAVVRDWHLLSFAAKWLFDDETKGEILTPKEIAEEDDSRLAKSLWNLLDEADIVVAYNGVGFDIKKANARFLKNGLTPPSYYVPVDPLLVAKKKFAITSNKMDYVSEFIEGDRKIHTNFALWISCVNGDQQSLDDMIDYNKQDVVVLENIYLNFLPWMEGNHPNLNVLYSDNVSRCPMCGSENISYTGKTYPTLTNLYEAFVCESCGYHGRNRTGILDKEKRKTIVR